MFSATFMSEKQQWCLNVNIQHKALLAACTAGCALVFTCAEFEFSRKNNLNRRRTLVQEAWLLPRENFIYTTSAKFRYQTRLVHFWLIKHNVWSDIGFFPYLHLYHSSMLLLHIHLLWMIRRPHREHILLAALFGRKKLIMKTSEIIFQFFEHQTIKLHSPPLYWGGSRKSQRQTS